MRLFIDYCFDHFKFKKIFLKTHHTNKSARTLAEKCGFEIEGKIRMDYKTTAGEIVDLIYYGRLYKDHPLKLHVEITGIKHWPENIKERRNYFLQNKSPWQTCR